jgi:hypothetical protein
LYIILTTLIFSWYYLQNNKLNVNRPYKNLPDYTIFWTKGSTDLNVLDLSDHPDHPEHLDQFEHPRHPRLSWPFLLLTNLTHVLVIIDIFLFKRMRSENFLLMLQYYLAPHISIVSSVFGTKYYPLISMLFEY